VAEVAAYQVAFLTWNLLALALDALAIAGQAIVGRNLGAGDVAGTRAAVRRMVGWGVWAGIGLGLLVLVVRPFLGPAFGLEPAVASALSATLVVVALQQPVAGPVFVLDGVLIGSGDNRWLAWAQIVVLVAYLPVAAAVPVLWSGTAGLVALWVALLWFLVVRLALLTWRERGDAWLVVGAQR
jgi:Na+-driven multidrug efflux pump